MKACHFWTDIGKGVFELFYLRDKDKHEVDFLMTQNKKPWMAVEVKSQDTAWSGSFDAFRKHIAIPYCFQVTRVSCPKKVWQDERGVCGILDANNFLAHLP